MFSLPVSRFPAQALFGELPLIIRKQRIPGLTQFLQIFPGVDAAIVAIVENDANRIIAGGDHGTDGNIAFAGHCDLLSRPMALHLGRGLKHAQHLGLKAVNASIIEGNGQFAPVFRHKQLGRPGIAHFSLPQARHMRQNYGLASR